MRVSGPTLFDEPNNGEFGHIRRHQNSVSAKQHGEKNIPAHFLLLCNQHHRTFVQTLDEINPDGLSLLRMLVAVVVMRVFLVFVDGFVGGYKHPHPL